MPDSALKRLANLGSKKSGVWLIAAIESVQESNGPGRFDPGFIHPSDLGNECDAFIAFRYLGAPGISNISARTRRIFDNGSGRDYYLKRDVDNSGVSLITREEDRAIEIPTLHIRGELDAWVKNPITGVKHVVDFKTMNSREFDLLKEIKHSHHLQLHPYMVAKDTYNGLVLYENKNDQTFKVMEGNFDGQIWQIQIVERIEKILDNLQHNVVDRNPAHCSTCPFGPATGTCVANKIEELKEGSGLTF